MKTLTIDFALYQKELDGQYLAGFRKAMQLATRIVNDKAKGATIDRQLADYCDDDPRMIDFVTELYKNG